MKWMKGKTIVSGNVIRCFKEKGTSEYNKGKTDI